MHFVLNNAFRALNDWLTLGISPIQAPRIEVDASNPFSPVLVTDPSTGNVLGGIRTPLIDVPFATYSGLGNTPLDCIFYGTETLYSPAELTALYPTPNVYLREFDQDTFEDFLAGYLLVPDAEALVSIAEQANIP
jgi:hypothetical protein